MADMITIDGTIFDNLKKLKINISALFTFLYIIFLFFIFIDAINKLSTLKSIYEQINNYTIHALGILFTINTLISTFRSKQSRQFAVYKLGLLFIEQKRSELLDADDISRAISEREVQQSLIQFSIDANELMIFAGDADFLINNDGTRSDQFPELRGFGHNCKLLLNERLNVDIEILKDLTDAGMQIKLYPKSKPNVGLRGRIKTTDAGRTAMLFDKKMDNYIAQEIKNSYLLQMLVQEYEDVFSRGRNPFVKYILFDLAGVYCEGDIEVFFNEIKEFCNVDLEHKNQDYLCIDDRLNLAKNGFTIIDYVEEKGNLQLDIQQKKGIREKWNNTWTVNLKMQELAYRLRDNGYTVGICSNCDEDNGEKYLIRNYFNGFDRFFSYQMNMLKPTSEYFQAVLEHYKCKPYECLFIDDHEDNIDAAKKLNFLTLKVTRNHTEDEKVSKLKKEFDKLFITYSEVL